MRERARYLPRRRGTQLRAASRTRPRPAQARNARGIAVAEVDDQQDADKADVDLQEHAAIVIVVRKRRGALRTEAVGDRLPGLGAGAQTSAAVRSCAAASPVSKAKWYWSAPARPRRGSPARSSACAGAHSRMACAIAAASTTAAAVTTKADNPCQHGCSQCAGKAI